MRALAGCVRATFMRMCVGGGNHNGKRRPGEENMLLPL